MGDYDEWRVGVRRVLARASGDDRDIGSATPRQWSSGWHWGVRVRDSSAIDRLELGKLAFVHNGSSYSA